MYIIVTRAGRGSKSVIVLPSLETYCVHQEMCQDLESYNHQHVLPAF